MKRYLNSILSFVIVISIFLSYSITAYAVPKRLKDGTWIDVPWSEYGEEIGYLLQYAFSTMGVIFNGDLEQWIKNNETYKDLYDENGRLARHTTVNPETETVSYDKEIMVVLKELINDYAKQEQTKEENGGFYLIPTISLDEVPAKWFKDAMNYQSFRGIVTKYGMLVIRPRFAARYNCMGVGDPFEYSISSSDNNIVLVDAADSWGLDNYKNDNTSFVNVRFYDSVSWKYKQYEWRYCNLPSSEPYMDLTNSQHYPFASTTSTNYYYSVVGTNNNLSNTGEASSFLCSSDGRRVRVFVSEDAAINYTAAKRKVYFSKEYYSYVPEDLTVSIDDLQKTVDDLQKIIDELLKQIGDNTSEKEIEELLKKILEELQKNPGSGSGSGSGGDVNVDIDLSTTNSWLAKIYAKVSQIFDKISETAGNASDAVHARIQESLDEIVEQLKKLKRWTAVDTVIDGVDALADWLSLLYDIVKDAESGVGSAVSAVSSALGETVDLASRKFPFSIPWDILFFVSVMSSEPQVPQFEIPFDIELSALDIRIDYTMQLDFSQFQWLSDLSRLILSLTYAAGLLKMTFRVTSAGKEE